MPYKQDRKQFLMKNTPRVKKKTFSSKCLYDKNAGLISAVYHPTNQLTQHSICITALPFLLFLFPFFFSFPVSHKRRRTDFFLLCGFLQIKNSILVLAQRFLTITTYQTIVIFVVCLLRPVYNAHSIYVSHVVYRYRYIHIYIFFSIQTAIHN